MRDTVFDKSFSVRYYEVGPSRLVRPTTLLDYLQDAAAEHVTLLGVGVPDLHHRDLTWVLSRLRLAVGRYPGVGESVRVRTWPSTRSGLAGCREFEVVDETGTIVARATTSWILIDLVRRRPVRIAEILPDYPLDQRRAIDDDFRPLPRPTADARETGFTVRPSDLDMNHHVNNAVYVGWALDASPPELTAAGRPAEIEVVFRAEALAGDAIRARCSAQTDAVPVQTLHEIVREQDGKELARMRVLWSPF